MNDYLFYTTEGVTFSPNAATDIENCQILGYSKGKDKFTALQNLLIENKWIKESKFDESKIAAVQILSQDVKDELRILIDYLWRDEERHFEESGKPENHIINIIQKINELIV